MCWLCTDLNRGEYGVKEKHDDENGSLIAKLIVRVNEFPIDRNQEEINKNSDLKKKKMG